jgi:hypothetical protein
MVTMHEEYNTEEQFSLMFFLWAEGLIAKDIHKEICSVYCGKCFVV